MEEIWKDVKGYEDRYMVSNLGRVISKKYHCTDYPKELKYDIAKRGYKRVTFSIGCKTERFSVHRLVAEHFLENPLNLPMINHKDENPSNNNVENLEWCDAQYNVDYSLSKSICQCSMNGDVIKVWTSSREANRNGFDKKSIYRCLNNVCKQHKGYTWRYAVD